ncbi:MAG: rhomboid family intramembrane serine protease [Pseudomonadota bacterium]|nr:rhomboid family intramembrane serine protease [Pseudomonadota bacterium]
MLILPLHRVPGGSIAWCTLALILVNVFAHFVLQAGDSRIREQAMEHYVDSGLAGIEAPLYRRYLEANRRYADAESSGLPQAGEHAGDAMQAHLIDLEPGFQNWAGREGFSADADRRQWQQARSTYEELKSGSITDRYMLRGNEVDPLRMFTATFLHADVGHLLGNMLFLFLVGHLVEAALGARRYLLLYVVAGLGASAAALAWRWGEPSAGLGASGAIAGLMGAYCVLWGRRKVRFFYWFFIYFDYVRAPAIWLLPAWLGWEVAQMLLLRDAGVAFEAHAGGLVTGALAAVVIKRWGGGVDEAHLALDENDKATNRESRLEVAMQALGRMELDLAEQQLRSLLASHPDWLPARIAHYRVARYRGDKEEAQLRATHALSIHAGGADLGLQAELARDAIGFGLRIVPDTIAALANRLVDAERLDAARQLLQAVETDIGEEAIWAKVWLRLALAEERAGQGDCRAALALIVQRFPDSESAKKARFLLEQG